MVEKKQVEKRKLFDFNATKSADSIPDVVKSSRNREEIKKLALTMKKNEIRKYEFETSNKRAVIKSSFATYGKEFGLETYNRSIDGKSFLYVQKVK